MLQRSTAVLLAGAVLLLAGCTPPPAESAKAAAALERYPAYAGKPMPQGPQYTDDEAIAAWTAGLDQRWADVARAYPDAVRPDIPFSGWADEAGEDLQDLIYTCLEEYGIPRPVPLGPGASTGTELTTVEQQIGSYTCYGQHTTRPVPPLTREQVGWLYDYLIGHSIPCWEHFGYELGNPPVMPRDAWVAGWPNAGWWPSPNIDGMADLAGAAEQWALSQMCPPPGS